MSMFATHAKPAPSTSLPPSGESDGREGGRRTQKRGLDLRWEFFHRRLRGYGAMANLQVPFRMAWSTWTTLRQTKEQPGGTRPAFPRDRLHRSAGTGQSAGAERQSAGAGRPDYHWSADPELHFLHTIRTLMHGYTMVSFDTPPRPDGTPWCSI